MTDFLIVSKYLDSGGAARAARNMYFEFIHSGIDAKHLVLTKGKSLFTFSYKLVQKLNSFFHKYCGLTINVIEVPSFLSNVDLNSCKVLYWHAPVTGCTHLLKKIARAGVDVRIVMHDESVYTGGCTYAMGCLGFVAGCYNCPQSRKSNIFTKFLIRRSWRSRQKLSTLVHVGVSSWIAKRMQLRHKTLTHLAIPNFQLKPVADCGVERCYDYGFFAINAFNDKRKGLEFVHSIFHDDSISRSSWLVVSDIELGWVPTISTLTSRKEYSESLFSCKIVVVPSIIENYSNTMVEALMHGCLVVAFEAGGNSEIIDHGYNGYLAQSGNIDDLKTGLIWARKMFSNDLSQRIKEEATKKHHYKKLVQKHLSIESINSDFRV